MPNAVRSERVVFEEAVLRVSSGDRTDGEADGVTRGRAHFVNSERGCDGHSALGGHGSGTCCLF
jgi:hypothetical protein